MITMASELESESSDATTDPEILAALHLARAGTAYFFQHLDALPDGDFAGPSLLPGWDRAHVVAHVGHNGTGLSNLAEWAATGLEKPMYTSPEFRNAQIEEGATLPPDELRQLCRDTVKILDNHWQALSDAHWKTEIRLGQGRLIPASTTVWMRTREMFLHTVDLNSGASYDDFPDGFTDHLLADVLSTWRGRAAAEGIPNFVVMPADRDKVRSVGSADDPEAIRLHGSAANLARWVTGRGDEGVSTESGEPVPLAPKWL